MLNISRINIPFFRAQAAPNKNITKLNNVQNNTFEFPSYSYFPSNSQINFTGSISLKDKVVNIGKENLPNEKIWDMATSDDAKKQGLNLFDVHTAVYAPLLECNTLDEAKEKFPEFKDVIDAKDMEYSDMTYSMRRIADGEIQGISIDELSLVLLKKVYGEVLSFKESENYFGFTNKTSMGMADRVNIPKMKKPYDQSLKRCTPKKCSAMAAARKKYINEHPEEEELRRQKILRFYQEHPEIKQEKSDNLKEFYKRHPEALEKFQAANAEYFVEHPEKRAEINDIISNWSKDNPELEIERRKKCSQSLKAFHKAHPEYREAQRQAWDNYSEYKDIMSLVAKGFPQLSRIIDKQKRGERLKAFERIYLAQYFQACHEAAPDMKKDISQEHSRLISELKAQKKQDESNGIDMSDSTECENTHHL